MSYDFLLIKACNHRVFKETLPIDGDTHSQVSIPRPVSNSNIEVFIDGIRIPKSGLYSEAKYAFPKSAPYRFESGKSDLLYIEVGNSSPRVVQLLTGSNLSAQDVARDLSVKVRDLAITVENNRVVLTNHSPSGLKGLVFTDPTRLDPMLLNPITTRILKAYEAIGVSPGRAVTCHRIYPGWALRKNIYSFQEDRKAVYFDSPLQNFQPKIEISYSTTSFYCRRCVGSNVEYDYNVSNGTYLKAENTELLQQEFDKYLFTTIGSHYKWRWLGSTLSERIGGKNLTSQNGTSGLINLDVNNTFRTYSNIKSQQYTGFPQQRVTDAEYPGNVTAVNVASNPNDPTVAEITVNLTDKSGNPITISRIVGTPNPLSITNNSTATIQKIQGTGYKFRG